ncbi:helix-turn-helix domain-containing protein [Herbaspirillum sp. RTI4]|uniref:helix-turn-helix domain-containing protein n=1 Tax=Herbaspirillum sp. RTI4 TaxID=3048640 RepID=UPI002AB479F1|nr:helix-turn-helix domain-containing protein [Herbaspirillum sp. RTI4]MDY7579441.1 helix-turn-helix domain-containing protein [Herbaspirillum sp. RTI4]MEA9980355.1 helix-turn-helix domain-containing protein [Herbaspirillum sp. RTI4]
MSARTDALAAILHTMPGNDCAIQRGRMLAAMERLGSVTTYEASRYLDCYDPRPRIHEMRSAGKRIKTVYREEQTESGVYHRVGVYLLEGRTDE